LSPEGAQLAAEVGARALLAVPIATAERAWGLLVVFLQRGPLFPADDLDLLLLFTEQSAIALEQKTLVEDLRRRTGQLEAANKELEAFSYSVSHDLRAPLRHIEGFTDLLHKSSLVADDDKNRHYLRRISEATVRMGRLIDNLLDFSRLGRAEIYATPVNLDQVVEGARRELLSESEGRDVVWNVSQLPNVYGDPALLRLVFVNLLSNALKYTRSRSPAQIEIGHLPDREGQTAIYVRDNGVGFDMQYADKLFGVFQRLHRADEFEGTGIGLANVRRIIHRHGGNTWAESAPDGGATFYFSLPTLAPGLATSTTSVPLPAPGSGEDLPARTTKPSLTPSPHLMRAPEAITDD
ncbi:MAG: sensor histidine kinase, partial [Anaerolineales bacterium]